MVKNREVNGTEEIALVTPTPVRCNGMVLYMTMISTTVVMDINTQETKIIFLYHFLISKGHFGLQYFM